MICVVVGRSTRAVAGVVYNARGMTPAPAPNRRFVTAGLVAAAWVLFALFFAAQAVGGNAYAGRPLEWGRTLVAWFTCAALWAAATPGVVWLARRFPVLGAGRARAIAVHVGAGLAITVVQLALYTLLQAFAWRNPSYFASPAGAFTRLLVWETHSNFLIYLVIAGITQALDVYRDKRERELVASRLEAQLAQAQLDALRMQLHPHFLFNTLNTISVLMQQDVEAANRMLVRLSGLLRAALATSGTQEVALRDELEFLGNYLEIERTRFHDRLRVSIEADPATLDAKVPNLVLQPIVENAIKHGIAPRAAAGIVEVRAVRSNGSLELSVRDDGPGLGAGGGREGGIGIANTRARLERLYGERSGLELSDAPGGGTLATISIPFHA
jgi:two-component system LytT family sensor kinase